MTSPSPSVDPVRERLQQISNEWMTHDDGGTPALIAAIEAVLELHRPEKPVYMPRYGNYSPPKPRAKRCATCWDGYRAEDRWPCTTYRAIAAGLGVTP
jgi:hypothetical protein